MKDYYNIITPIYNELLLVDKYLKDWLYTENNPTIINLINFLFSDSKKIRSAVSFLCIYLISNRISDSQIKISALVELLHNASLIHDDVIDNSDTRRNKPSLKNLYGNQQAVLIGDFLLAVALSELAKINNQSITSMFAKSFINVCNGEIQQNLNQHNYISIDKYILKSEQKTAELFKLTLKASMLQIQNSKYLQFAENFGKYFGIAFQIRNDIDDIFYKKSTDFQNGIYTAPIIYYLQNNKLENCKNVNINSLLTNDILEQSNSLCSFYAKKALDLLDDFSDNQYRKALVNLCELIQKGN
ncbi:polyprenyl synthetase family protein [bacterium]|nr:polyprenyl synthetase family protein [bacterium]